MLSRRKDIPCLGIHGPPDLFRAEGPVARRLEATGDPPSCKVSTARVLKLSSLSQQTSAGRGMACWREATDAADAPHRTSLHRRRDSSGHCDRDVRWAD